MPSTFLDYWWWVDVPHERARPGVGQGKGRGYTKPRLKKRRKH